MNDDTVISPPAPGDEPIETMENLRQAGWSEAFALERDGLSWADEMAPTDEFRVARTYRFEGESDPGDETMVLAVEHVPSHTRGYVYAAFGPAAPREQASVLRSLAHHARHDER